MMSEVRIELLTTAIGEAERFIEKARLAIDRLEDEEYIAITGSKETAAAKRASMDLSRTLSELRK